MQPGEECEGVPSATRRAPTSAVCTVHQGLPGAEVSGLPYSSVSSGYWSHSCGASLRRASLRRSERRQRGGVARSGLPTSPPAVCLPGFRQGLRPRRGGQNLALRPATRGRSREAFQPGGGARPPGACGHRTHSTGATRPSRRRPPQSPSSLVGQCGGSGAGHTWRARRQPHGAGTASQLTGKRLWLLRRRPQRPPAWRPGPSDCRPRARARQY
jgi:hypothetical protein